MRLKLKELRKKLGYTQKGFANELGISKRTYESIEQGLRFPGQSNMIKIMKKLNIDSIAIFANIPNEKTINYKEFKGITEVVNIAAPQVMNSFVGDDSKE